MLTCRHGASRMSGHKGASRDKAGMGRKTLVITLVVAGIGVVCGVGHAGEPQGASCPSAADYLDPTYGGRVRHIRRVNSHTHNIYYHRNPWNADNSYMIGVESDLDHRNWRVVLYQGDGCFLRELFPITEYDWRLVWDRQNPEILYTWNWKRAELYRLNVRTGKADLLKSFAPLGVKPTGPSLNQAGDRILMITSEGTYRSFRLPDMREERSFKVAYPDQCVSAWRDERYIGYRNYIMTACGSPDLTRQAILIYDDHGTLAHRLEGIGGGGHFDFSPDGRLAFFRMPGRGNPLEIHVMSIDGTNDKVLYSAPAAQARHLQNLHVSWPDRVNDWFVASFFPSPQNLPPRYTPPLDEILLVHTDRSPRFLARTETLPGRGAAFWGQPLASPSANGSRVSFNSNRSGTIAQYILWVPPELRQ